MKWAAATEEICNPSLFKRYHVPFEHGLDLRGFLRYDALLMHDLQSSKDSRGVFLQKAGICNLRYPIWVADPNHEKQRTVGKFSLQASVESHVRGTHMSRFVECLLKHENEPFSIPLLRTILCELQSSLEARTTFGSVSFPYFLSRIAPGSQSESLMDYQVTLSGVVSREKSHFISEVKVPVASVCPCSKAISDYGAHNQRGYIKICMERGSDALVKDLRDISDAIHVAERAASSPVYTLLKRSDERVLTMNAYDNPVFVEDMVRNVAVELKKDPSIAWYRVTAENIESIHNHNAYAEMQTGPSPLDLD